MPEPLDQPTVVRPESSFDVASLAAWLRAREPGLEGSPELLQFGRGFSNLTYLVRFPTRELVVRRAPPGINIKSAHDMGREFRILGRARADVVEGAAPDRPLRRRIGHRDAVLRHGARARRHPAHRGGAGGARARRGDDAASVRVDVRHARGDSQARLASGRPRRSRQAGGVRRAPGARLGRSVPQGARPTTCPPSSGWARGSRSTDPPRAAPTLVHNDFKYDNVVLAPDLSGVIAVLDWEMATIGDPLMDLGTALGYWIEPGDRPMLQGRSVFGPTNRPGNLTRMQFVRALVAGHGSGRVERRLLLCVRALQARGHLAAALQAIRRRTHDGRALRSHARQRAIGDGVGPRRRRKGAHRPPDGVITRRRAGHASGPGAAIERSRPSGCARP